MRPGQALGLMHPQVRPRQGRAECRAGQGRGSCMSCCPGWTTTEAYGYDSCTCLYACVCLCVCLCLCLCLSVSARACVRVCLCLCVCLFVCVCVRMHACLKVCLHVWCVHVTRWGLHTFTLPYYPPPPPRCPCTPLNPFSLLLSPLLPHTQARVWQAAAQEPEAAAGREPACLPLQPIPHPTRHPPSIQREARR